MEWKGGSLNIWKPKNMAVIREVYTGWSNLFFVISSGSFEVGEAEGVSRGTKVILHLKEDCKRFALKTAVEGESLPLFPTENYEDLHIIWNLE